LGGRPAGAACGGIPSLALVATQGDLGECRQCPRREAPGYRDGMTVLRSVVLFALAALAEIGGAWLVWQGIREHRGLVFVGAGILALGLYGFAATFQPDPHFGRILAAYGGVFVAGSLAWGVLVDGFRPDRYDLLGAALCLAE
jgi:small multidrug resistance family-3 protein